MSINVETCYCFFNVGLFAKMDQMKCKKLQNLCSYIRKVGYFFHSHPHKKTYIICCTNFIKDSSNYLSRKTCRNIKERLCTMV